MMSRIPAAALQLACISSPSPASATCHRHPPGPLTDRPIQLPPLTAKWTHLPIGNILDAQRKATAHDLAWPWPARARTCRFPLPRQAPSRPLFPRAPASSRRTAGRVPPTRPRRPNQLPRHARHRRRPRCRRPPAGSRGTSRCTGHHHQQPCHCHRPSRRRGGGRIHLRRRRRAVPRVRRLRPPTVVAAEAASTGGGGGGGPCWHGRGHRAAGAARAAPPGGAVVRRWRTVGVGETARGRRRGRARRRAGGDLLPVVSRVASSRIFSAGVPRALPDERIISRFVGPPVAAAAAGRRRQGRIYDRGCLSCSSGRGQ
jgi:hypothetical protein